MRVKVSRQRQKEHDIFTQGNLVVHKTEGTIMMVVRPHKNKFIGIVMERCDYYDKEVGFSMDVNKLDFEQFYGVITLIKEI